MLIDTFAAVLVGIEITDWDGTFEVLSIVCLFSPQESKKPNNEITTIFLIILYSKIYNNTVNKNNI